MSFASEPPRLARWLPAFALALALSAVPVASASAHDGHSHAAEPSPRLLAEALGQRATPQMNGLYRVPVSGGPDLLTHGPDLQLADAGSRDAELGPGSPERPPVCATGNYQQVLLGRPIGTPDRLASVREPIRAQMRRTNALLNQESLASGGPTADYKVLCVPGGQISVESFTAAGSSFSQVVAGARAAGYDNPDVDYTIFFDDPSSNACGVGSYYEDERLSVDNAANSGGGYAVAYSGCWYGETVMHENGHNQGAVQSGAPYSTGDGGHCWDERDVMCYSPDGGNLHQGGTVTRCADRLHFDCGWNTYFDSAPEPGEYLATHWNIGSRLNRFIAFGGPRPANAPPGAGFELSCAGLTCDFSDSSTDPDGTILRRSWTFGDGTSAYGGSPSHRFAAAGTYAVTLSVSDDDGATKTATRQVTVSASRATVPVRKLRSGSRLTARSGAAGSWDFYSYRVRHRTEALRVRLASPACRQPSCDLDLYVRRDAKPTLGAYACRSGGAGSKESCKLAKPRARRVIVGVHVDSATAPARYRIEATARRAANRR